MWGRRGRRSRRRRRGRASAVGFGFGFVRRLRRRLRAGRLRRRAARALGRRLTRRRLRSRARVGLRRCLADHDDVHALRLRLRRDPSGLRRLAAVRRSAAGAAPREPGSASCLDGAEVGDALSLPRERGADGMESAATSATTSATPTITAAMSAGLGLTAPSSTPGAHHASRRAGGPSSGPGETRCLRGRRCHFRSSLRPARRKGTACTAWPSGGSRANRAKMRFITLPSRFRQGAAPVGRAHGVSHSLRPIL